ncbi:MAG: hypothetical protein ABIX44_00120 [Cryobacterium sp.]
MNKDEELARLEAAVYSRAGSSESAVDFVDPVTGETLRATPSELRLRELRAERAGQAAGQGAHDGFIAFPDTGAEGAVPTGMPVRTPGLSGPSRRRRPLPLVAAAAFSAGIAAALIAPSILGGIGATTPRADERAALLAFDRAPQYPGIPIPDLGDQFVPESLRNVSGPAASTSPMVRPFLPRCSRPKATSR